MPSLRSQPIINLITHQPSGHELFHSALRYQSMRSHEGTHRDALEDIVQFIKDHHFNTPIFINISSALISESNRFFRQVKNALKRLQDVNKAISLEFTEESAGATFEQRVRCLEPLCQQIILDDFGSLSSNLDRLMRIQPNAVKLDQTLLRTLSSDHQYHGIYAALIELFARLQIDVIAEGIENNSQYQWLRSHGVHQGQGYYLEPPRIQAVF